MLDVGCSENFNWGGFRDDLNVEVSKTTLLFLFGVVLMSPLSRDHTYGNDCDLRRIRSTLIRLLYFKWVLCIDMFNELLINVGRPSGKMHLQNVQLRVRDVPGMIFLLPIIMA